jgi:hypothetical protein
MQVGLGENLTEYIRHYLMRTGAIVKQPDVYFTLKERVGQSDAVAELKRLNRFAGYYRCLLEPDREPNPAIRRALLRLRRFELTTTYPFMLNCYDDYTQGQLSAEDFLEVLKAVENYIMRRWVCNYPTNELKNIFPVVHRQAVQHAGGFVAGVRAALVGRQYPSDTEFKNSLLTAKLYGAGERREKTKLLLEALEESYGHKEAPDFAALTIEHVMPQTPNKWWQDHLGEDWESDHELYVDTLGNLTLTAYNSELSNASFPEKQSQYSRSHVELNKYFSALTHWDRAAIEERARVLAQRALEIYPYLGGERVQPKAASDITGSKPHALWILGQQFRVNAWRDVLETTLNALSEIEPEEFERAVQRYHRFLGKDPGRFRAHRQLKSGLYFEVDLSSKEIYSLCMRIAEEMGLSNEDWRVEY